MITAVIGAGTMGTGIAQLFAQSGYSVTLFDVNETSLNKSVEKIKSHLQRAYKKNTLNEDVESVLQRIKTTINIIDLKEVDYVTEAIPEKMALKQSLLLLLESICCEKAIFSTNTSGLNITELSSVLKFPERLIGTHYFYPPPVMSLVEVVRGHQTSNETFEIVKKLMESLNKKWIEVKESPLFVVNRILIPMINEAICVLEEGISSKEEIDEAMKLGAHHPIGPITLADTVGLDTVLNVMETLYVETNNRKYQPSKLLYGMVEKGKLGRKTGEGFYQYMAKEATK
ncbi:3-hydroxyacyl-CoA dehydrogenase NAD-binding domain-containing protein [Neobacillus novalis]|uniref:3-hydroxyacyl-CoA dehydrogenase NAD-binding domain-containing protein n=1 Tax=Neobacillus novalis TaxID=220687 RepID=A0AA95MMY5_9BACI|nr:3-hydroxyacyl-CoA dehydrogenase NAD-binding domain-containing protein [Neobacillus novalis]WHY83991.1 3-hydroxyacyl-CoA dehydrogenase NAD-binding domain-containing protein [Neobacillus novalis]